MKMFLKNSFGFYRVLPLLVFAFNLNGQSAQANLAEAHGFGSRSSALAGATTAWGFDGMAASLNPASLTVNKAKRFQLTFGFVYSEPHFKAIDNVVVDNEVVSDAQGPIRGNVSVDDYKPTFGTVIGARFLVSPKYGNASLGLTAFLPLAHTAYMDTGYSFIPEYVLYRSRTQRPQFYLAGAVEPITGLSVGAGVQAAFEMKSDADMFLQTQTSAQKPSTLRFSATMKPKLIPYFGLLYVSNKNEREKLVPETYNENDSAGAWSAGGVLHLERKSESHMNLRTNGAFLSPLPAFLFQFRADSVMYYDPLTIQLGGSFVYLPKARLFLGADFQAWSQYESSAPVITPSGGGANMNAGGPPSSFTRDIIIPRVAHELFLGPWALRAGYSYRPSIFKGAPNQNGNFLDPSRDIFTFGLGRRLGTLLGEDLPCSVDFHGSFHSMRSQQIVKDSGNELGQGSGVRRIGAPGYDSDGYVWGVGVSMTVGL